MRRKDIKRILTFSILVFISINIPALVFAENGTDAETEMETEMETETETEMETETEEEVVTEESITEEAIKEESIEKEEIETEKENIKEETKPPSEESIKIQVTSDKEVKSIKTEFDRIFIEGTSVAGTRHTITAEATSSKKLLYRFFERNLKTNKLTVIQDYSQKNTANWVPNKEGDYCYGVDIKEVASKADSDISKNAPIRIEPSIPAELHNLEITGTNEAKTPHVIKSKATGVNGVLYRFYVKEANASSWTMIQDYSEKDSVSWTPGKPGNYLYSVNVKDTKSGLDKEAERSEPINISPLQLAKIESLEITGSKYEKTKQVIKAKATSTNGVLYKFYVKNEDTGETKVLRGFHVKDYANWIPKETGNYSYHVDVKDKMSDRYRDGSISYDIIINPPIYYNVTEYEDTLTQALGKQDGKNTISKNGKWVVAKKVEVEKYLNPDRFLQFKPESGSSKREGTVTTSSLNVRIGPGAGYDLVGKTTKGKVHNILAEKNAWYQIDLNGSKGWVSGAYMNVVGVSQGEKKHILSVEIVPTVLNVRKDPNTTSSIVSAVKSGGVYIVLESKSGWHKINANGKIGWVSAKHTKYVNDVPREMYQFMVLSGQAGITTDQMNNELIGKGILAGKGAAFIEGSKKYNVNELYLMAHALLETGNGTSRLATGIRVTSVDGKAVVPRVVYNMYGIGARDHAAERLGSEMAYKQGWFTPEIAIKEGAEWISKEYINHNTRKQDTIYKMKYNPANPGTHQYATDIAWALKQTRHIEIMMDLCRRIDGVIIRFDIPKYK